jgi:hypothetical protein
MDLFFNCKRLNYLAIKPGSESEFSVGCSIGLATEYRSEKIPRNRLRMDSVILRKKVVIPRYSEVYGRLNSEARNGTELHEKNNGFTKNHAPSNIIDSVFLP